MTESLAGMLKRFQQQHAAQGELTRDSRILLIDGMNMFIGAFSASPAMNYMGEHIGGLKGFLSSILSCIARFEPTRCIVVFDGKDGSANRRRKFSEYKEGRRNRIRLNRSIEMSGVLDESAALRDQLLKVISYLDCMPVSCITMDYTEADDIIGYIVSEHYGRSDSEIIIVSSDKDFFQLVNERVKVYRTTEKKVYDVDAIKESFGIPPSNFLTYRAMTGDVSDNIQGVHGIGLKTLIKIIPEIQSTVLTCEDVIRIASSQVDSGSKLKSYKSIVNSSKQIALNEELMQLSDVDIPANKKLTVTRILESSVPLFDEFAFRRLINQHGLNHVGSEMLSPKSIISLSHLNKYAEATSG